MISSSASSASRSAEGGSSCDSDGASSVWEVTEARWADEARWCDAVRCEEDERRCEDRDRCEDEDDLARRSVCEGDGLRTAWQGGRKGLRASDRAPARLS
jgi:hypothetical protein